jgi:WD40 repeat protein
MKSFKMNNLLEKKYVQTMDVFNSIDTNLPYIVYISNITDIIFYNCKSNEITSTIKEAHGFFLIINIRHYLYDNKDIILSASLESSIKLWKVRTLECFLKIKKSNVNSLISAFLFMDKKQYFIAVANQIRNLRVFDMNAKSIKEIQNSERYGNYLENYFSKITSKKYLIYCGIVF